MTPKYATTLIECPCCKKHIRDLYVPPLDHPECPACGELIEFEPVKRSVWQDRLDELKFCGALVGILVVAYSINFAITVAFVWAGLRLMGK